MVLCSYSSRSYNTSAVHAEFPECTSMATYTCNSHSNTALCKTCIQHAARGIWIHNTVCNCYNKTNFENFKLNLNPLSISPFLHSVKHLLLHMLNTDMPYRHFQSKMFSCYTLTKKKKCVHRGYTFQADFVITLVDPIITTLPVLCVLLQNLIRQHVAVFNWLFK